MLRALPWRRLTIVVLTWTAGLLAIWAIAELVLNPGVTEEDLQECRLEGFIPPAECEETLNDLEDQQVVIGRPMLVSLWLAGLFLIGLMYYALRQKPKNSGGR
jgi:hypothetical protein